jgi:sugar phosphate isomerase/epimerase
VTLKVAAVLGGILATGVFVAGGSALRVLVPSPLSPAAACTTAGMAGPFKAVFGHRRTAGGAATLFRQAVHVGFKNLAIVQAGPTDFEVDLFGVPTYPAGSELRAEARSAGLQVTIEPSRDLYCPDHDADREAVFGHRSTVPTVIALRAAVVKVGFTAARIERDGVRDYEVAVGGLLTVTRAHEFQAEAKTAGYRVVLERS